MTTKSTPERTLVVHDGPASFLAAVGPNPRKAGDTSSMSVLDAERARAFAAERAKSADAFLNQSPTTTPSFEDTRPTGAVPSLAPNPGMLRALLQPVIFFTLTEPVGAFEAGDTVAMQFWGEGRVMLTPLPREAAKGRIPTTFPANKLHGYIAVARHE